jgi:hypothetical protein
MRCDVDTFAVICMSANSAQVCAAFSMSDQEVVERFEREVDRRDLLPAERLWSTECVSHRDSRRHLLFRNTAVASGVVTSSFPGRVAGAVADLLAQEGAAFLGSRRVRVLGWALAFVFAGLGVVARPRS